MIMAVTVRLTGLLKSFGDDVPAITAFSIKEKMKWNIKKSWMLISIENISLKI